MKWIDMLKEMLATRGEFQATRIYNYTDSYGFLYECSFTDKNVVIYINKSDKGYQFDYTADDIIWSHPEGAEGLFSDEVRAFLKTFLKEY